MKRIRVLQINATYGSGSTGRLARDLQIGARILGFEMLTASTQRVNDESEIIGTPLDRKRHAIQSRITGEQGCGSVAATNSLVIRIKEFRPHVVHLHNLHSNFVNLPILLGALAAMRVAVVITLHDCWFFTGGCTHFASEGCIKWQRQCGSCPRLGKDVRSWIFDRTSKMLEDKVRLLHDLETLVAVGPSHWITSKARESLLQGRARFQTIYNWVDLEVFAPSAEPPTRRSAGRRGFQMLAVAPKWTDRKGAAIAMEVLEHLAGDETFTIVGDLDGKSLPREAHHIPDVKDPHELARLYREADVCLNFSLEESFGLVTAEALASGTPVITNSLTANPELVPVDCGRVVLRLQPGDYRQAIDEVKTLGKQSFTNACRRFAEEKFDSHANRHEYYDLYSELAGQGGAGIC